MAQDYETLRYETDRHVTLLSYDRPEPRAAVSRKMSSSCTRPGGGFATIPMPSCW